uniref:CDP-diacylglycerol--glycerol-3-phosphate 3-phosphatidyltransferase n=1 Tax=Attheya septentrionalis TaxID=420275 RepID=A0A6T7GI72_9STRA|mmetsp:Transcript_13500/g.24439  ORF Transcript_13500/g.24439 Transcript_13500/m.24439 type:complete len:579 (+) Transcript_13500:202-1938(+)
MSSAGARILRLLNAARGQYLPTGAKPWPKSASSPVEPYQNQHESTRSPLRCFPLKSHHIGGTYHPRQPNVEEDEMTPEWFHRKLCTRIQSAKHRVKLASLYVGAGTHPREKELLETLQQASNNNESLDIKILLDASRALRPISTGNDGDEPTSSALAVLEHIQESTEKKISQNGNGLYLFPILEEPLRSWLPSPLDEVAGVFHLKAYVIDDCLILSGANLSEEYFTDRQDRYMEFTNGGGGLVDFYSELIDVLCKYADPFGGKSDTIPFKKSLRRGLSSVTESNPESLRKRNELISSLTTLFDGSKDDGILKEPESCDNNEKETKSSPINEGEIIAYAIPTFQAPASFFGSKPPPFPCDVEVTRNLILAALEDDATSSSVRICSAYLNPTPYLLSALRQFCKGNAAYLLTAGPSSHGFAPKKNSTASAPSGSSRNWIPSAFIELTSHVEKEINPNNDANGSKVLLYERPGWTFHCKGLWLSGQTERGEPSSREAHFCQEEFVMATIVGSGNYGARSEDRDMESNCILILPEGADKPTPLQSYLAAEWNGICNHLSDFRQSSPTNFALKSSLPIIRKYL